MNGQDRRRWASHVTRTRITPTSFYREEEMASEGGPGTVVMNIYSGGVVINVCSGGVCKIYNNCKLDSSAEGPKQRAPEATSASTCGMREALSPETQATLSDIPSDVLGQDHGEEKIQRVDTIQHNSSVLKYNHTEAEKSEGEIVDEKK